MIGTLLTHSGAVRVDRQALRAIEAPPATRSWKPIGHGQLIDTIEEQLKRRSLAIRQEAYAIQRDGALFFGVIDLEWRETGDFAAAIGLRTANDKSFSLQIAVGFRVFVCDNLVFAGDLIALRRRHTAGLVLEREIAQAIDRYQDGVLRLEQGITHLKEVEISDTDAKAKIFDVFDKAILPVRFFPTVSEAYFRPPAEASDLQPRSLWGLHNAFTRQIRQMAPGPAFEATAELGQVFGLGADGRVSE